MIGPATIAEITDRVSSEPASAGDNPCADLRYGTPPHSRANVVIENCVPMW